VQFSFDTTKARRALEKYKQHPHRLWHFLLPKVAVCNLFNYFFQKKLIFIQSAKRIEITVISHLNS